MKLAKDTIDEFFEVPIGITEDLVHDLAEGLEQLFQEYTTFVASCGKRNKNIEIHLLNPRKNTAAIFDLIMFGSCFFFVFGVRFKTELHSYITSSYKMQQRFKIR